MSMPWFRAAISIVFSKTLPTVSDPLSQHNEDINTASTKSTKVEEDIPTISQVQDFKSTGNYGASIQAKTSNDSVPYVNDNASLEVLQEEITLPGSRRL